MNGKSGHITTKVIMGYIVLIFIAVCSVTYIYTIVEQVAGEGDSARLPRQKTYLVTNTLSLLYESEALGQLLGMPKNEFHHYNRCLDKAHRNIDTLRILATDSLQLLKIDTIDRLLEQKRWNTRRLLETWEESNAERLYAENIEKIISVQDTAVEEVEIQKRVEVKQDTVVVPRKKRGFFKRLAEVFVPSKGDTSILVNATRQVVTDTLVNIYNPSDTIISVLKSIQDSVAGQRQHLSDLLSERAANLRYNNSVITSRINQLLRDIEEEDMEASLERMSKKQKLLRDTSHLIAGIAVASVVIAVLFLFFIARDISRSQYYRMQLEKAKKYAEDLLHSREKLILTISHDIRAPLSSIIGYIELLLRRHPDERQQYFLENMKASSDHILSLVNDLLDFQRLEAGEMEIHHQVPFRVKALFQEIYTSFKPLAEGKGLQFVLNEKEGGPDCVFAGDPMRIRQIIGNLLSNAIKFTEAGRVVITVCVNSSGNGSEPASASPYRLEATVHDSGPGIAETEQEKIFGEFTRLEGTEETEGFGLGLSITRKLISLMGGTLSLQSRVGKGSDFTVNLPLRLAENQTGADVSAEVASAATLPGFQGKEICCLLVDDDPIQLALTEELLKQCHVRVVCCTNPHEVVKQLEQAVFDAVITDIQMPGMDGFRLLGMIRDCGIPRTDTLPVIALSASVANEEEHYLAAGFTAFLQKPFTAAQLISLLNTLLTTHLEIKTSLNFGSLTAFAGEDRAASLSILQTFTQETGKSIALLQKAWDDANRAEAARISHKLIPLFSMLGANTLVQHLRILEKNDEELTDDGWKYLLSEVIVQATSIVKQANAEA